ncbi:hypothetical protein ECC02_009353 [Trypanosoma cruzi]|uniref:Uncharacterized protein n=1 Tax=Trypanosoma cruzi TaxID=5693 RepID=A0A7J6XUU4_TRYCR|nr:hypothetical protein ECC02_009353 [Trypanosoma cruzi]
MQKKKNNQKNKNKNKVALHLFSCLAYAASLHVLACLSSDKLLLTLLNHVDAETLLLRQRHRNALHVLANHKNVGRPSSKLVSRRILQACNVERTRVALNRHDLANTAAVRAAGDHHHLAVAGLDEVHHLLLLQVVHQGVATVGAGVGVTNAVTVVCHGNRNAASARVDVLHLQELDVPLSLANLHEGKAALHVVQNAEAIPGPWDLHNVHEANRILGVLAGLTVHAHKALAENHLSLGGVQRILQTIADDDHKSHALTQLVGPSTGTWSKHARELAQHPVLGGIKALQVLLGHNDKELQLTIR